MFTVTRISTRQNTSISFWDFTPEQLDKIKSTYDDTGKRVSFTETLSENGLIQTRLTEWANLECQQEYNTEFAAFWSERDAYNSSNQIISVRL